MVFDHRPGYRDALFLSTRNLLATSSNVVVVASFKLRDELMRVGNLGGRDDLFFCRTWFPKSYILAHRSVKEDGLLPCAEA